MTASHAAVSAHARKRRRLSRWVLLPALALAMCTPAVAAPAFAHGKPAAGLQAELDRITAPFDGQIGVYVLDLDSGRTASVNPQIGFPMASTVKVPVAVHILSLVDEGKLDLQRPVVLKAEDIYPGMGGPIDTHLTPGSAITVHDLLHMMLTVSDNNATDILIKLGGGTAAVAARLHALGIEGIRVDRYIWEMLANFYGDASASQAAPLSPAAYARLEAQHHDPAESRALRLAYDADPRDTSTPAGMAALLSRVWQGKVLKPATTAVLESIMLDCRTGRQRLKGMLPDATPVAHKTGSVDDVANDVGVITLPSGRGRVVIAVFEKSEQDDAAKDRMMAQVARAAHDYFLFAGRE